mmetsp:Transcript_55709/g.131540  ORF Transcript_55709/g.131540 Transcript_55709/m.131540 type:complete len:205 (-) Transcript_55709:220-834(-)
MACHLARVHPPPTKSSASRRGASRSDVARYHRSAVGRGRRQRRVVGPTRRPRWRSCHRGAFLCGSCLSHRLHHPRSPCLQRLDVSFLHSILGGYHRAGGSFPRHTGGRVVPRPRRWRRAGCMASARVDHLDASIWRLGARRDHGAATLGIADAASPHPLCHGQPGWSLWEDRVGGWGLGEASSGGTDGAEWRRVEATMGPLTDS